jgi:P27 family predicted phage terminase small subunit
MFFLGGARITVGNFPTVFQRTEHMARGRRADDPRDQKAKGFPGKRKNKTEIALAKMERAAARDAQLLAQAGTGADIQALPIFLEDKRLAPATIIWREYAPRLDKLHLLTTLDRYTFAMFCIYAAEFVLANRDILDKGYSVGVPTIAKGKDGKSGIMLRENPAVSRRDFAAKMMLDLAEKYGLTPLDRNKLIREHAMRADEETLFGRVRSQPQQPTPHAPPADDEANSMVGSLARLDTPSPGKPN